MENKQELLTVREQEIIDILRVSGGHRLKEVAKHMMTLPGYSSLLGSVLESMAVEKISKGEGFIGKSEYHDKLLEEEAEKTKREKKSKRE